MSAYFYEFKQRLTGLHAIYSRTLFLINLQKGETILDVGCGTGRILRELHTQYGDIATYIGADPSTAMLERARKLAGTKPIQFIKTYADLLPLADDSCDWVVCTLAFHHIPNEAKPACIKEMLRVLKPSGTMLIVDIGKPQGVFGRFFAFFSHSHAFVKDNMETVEKALIGNNAEITKRDYQFGFIEYLTIKKQ